MPNWCDNNLYIRHTDKKLVEKAFNAFKEGKFFATLVPEPDYNTTPVAKTFPEIHAQHAKSEEDKEKALKNEPTIRPDAWWDWRVQNWGTKWDVGGDEYAGELQMYKDGSGFYCNFSSAWSPPIDAYRNLVEQGFEIQAYYYESGMCFCGKFDEGMDECYSFDWADDEKPTKWLEANIPKDILLEMWILADYENWEEEEVA